MNTKIKTTMFGNFQVEGLMGTLNDDIIHSDKISRLFAYILYNHKRKVTIQELSDILWGELEEGGQSGALKNLLYRLRTILKKYLGEDEYILTGRGTYFWNPDIPIELDSDTFEILYNSSSEKSEDEQLECYKEILDIYKGVLLPKLEAEYWVIAPSTYFHSRYLDVVKKAACLFYEKKEYSQMRQICERAIVLDPLDEELHYQLIVALKKEGNTKMALNHFTKAADILYENLGIRPSKKLQELHQALLKETNEKEMDLNTIQLDLLESAKPEGVFICEYGIFREIYRLLARQTSRYGMSIYVSLITLEPPQGLKPSDEKYLPSLKKGMDHLREVLTCLRSGDVAAKYSGAQYVVLLPTCTYESGKRVIERVMSNFFCGTKWNRYSIRYSLDEIETVNLVK